MKKAVVVGWCAAGVAICQQPKFELADVHSSTTSRIAAQNLGGVLRAGKYFNRDATMLELIEAAYKVKEDAIAGGPGWVASDLFDVIAKVPQGTKMAEANQMLQALLADRFKLVVKHETHPVPRYVLTVGKGGSKLKPASGSGQGCQPVPQPGEGSGSDPAFLQNMMVECHNMTTAEIADNLHQMAGGGYFDHDPDTLDNQMTRLIYQGGSTIRAVGTLRNLILMSRQASPNFGKDIVVGLPKFADETHWEINAKFPATGEGAPNVVNGRTLPPPLSIRLEMLNNLLIDRFGLKTHREQREITVYVLTAGKGKPKMTGAKDSDRTECRPAPNATPTLPGIRMTGCTNTSMRELAENLLRMAPAYIDHPVVDETGIIGGWNFFIGWTPRSMLHQVDNSNQPVGTAADPVEISFFEALERELGLKLVKQTRMYAVIVVDHIEEKPVE